MIKITASHSMKVPAEGEYTSKSFHLGLEAEVADTLGGEGILAKSRALFALAKAAVAAEINGKAKPAQTPANTTTPANGGSGGASGQFQGNGGNGNGSANGGVNGGMNGANGGNGSSASPKQISYLLLLAKKNGGLQKLNAAIREEYGLDDVAKLTRKQASGLIERLKGGSNGQR